MKVVSYGGLAINDGTNYTTMIVEGDFGLPPLRTVMVPRSGAWPAFAGVQRPSTVKTLRIFIENDAGMDALRASLMQTFDANDETPKLLVVENEDGSNDRYVMAICRALDHDRRGNGRVFVATLDVDGDPLWREVTATTDTWNITASGQTKTVSNGGNDDAYPTYTITPTATKAGYNVYKRWVPIVWKAGGDKLYPLDLSDGGAAGLDTATLVTAGKMQADGDDLRVVVDGAEVYRWLDAMNTANTRIWVNLYFDSAPSTLALLESNMGSGDTVTSIDSSTDINGYPSSGLLLIGSEAFVYTGKNNSLRRFTGVTRAAKGTTAAAHTAGDTMYWVQHDIWITYGNASASAPAVDDNYKPIFSLSNSTNISWDYDDFGENDGLRTGAWSFINLQNTAKYTANQNTNADPWSEMGVRGNGSVHSGRWQLFNPLGITAANFQNGEKWADFTPSNWTAHIASSVNGASWVTEYNIPAPSAATTYEAWSQNETLESGSYFVALWKTADDAFDPPTARVEVADVTVTLNSSNRPAITINAEQGNYPLACILKNNTTGEQIAVTLTMDENEDLEINTDEKTVTYLADGSNQFGAVEVQGTVRKDWLRLVPGNNELQFDDVGTAGLTIESEWEERFYG